jgi:hypothetical protein
VPAASAFPLAVTTELAPSLLRDSSELAAASAAAEPALLPNPAPAATPEFAAEAGAIANMLIPNPAPFASPLASPSQYQTTAKPGVSNVFACEPQQHYKQTNRFVNLSHFVLELLCSLSPGTSVQLRLPLARSTIPS